MDELRQFVTRHPTAGGRTCKRELEALWYDQSALETERFQTAAAGARAALLRGQSTGLSRCQGHHGREPARKYADALATTQQNVSNVKKAEAFTAAKLARTEGLSILGTEVAPDWGWVDGI